MPRDVREVFRAMGDLLTKQGILKNRRDIFYLTVDEVFGWVQATTVTVTLNELIDPILRNIANFINRLRLELNATSSAICWNLYFFVELNF